jgi:hypothetical protein
VVFIKFSLFLEQIATLTLSSINPSAIAFPVPLFAAVIKAAYLLIQEPFQNLVI